MNLMNDAQLGQALADRPAPTVTIEKMQERIKSVEFSLLPKTTVTVCNITLDNGYSVRGESACVDIRNYDQAIGERIAYDNAVKKLWPLFGFLLAEQMHEATRRIGDGTFSPEDVAEIAHEANRALCNLLPHVGDKQPSWADAPDWQRKSAIQGVLFHLDHPDANPAASHENWMREKLADGWTRGDVKDAEAKTHPCIVPFDRLPHSDQAKDHLFRAIVHALAPFTIREDDLGGEAA